MRQNFQVIHDMNDELKNFNMNQIIPAILPTSQAELEEKVSGVLGLVKRVQVDVCDGIVVPSKTEFSSLPNQDGMEYELDLMVNVKSVSDLEKFILMKPRSIVLHLEFLAEPKECLDYVKNKGIEIGLAIGNDTPSNFVNPFVSEISFVQLMGISEIGSQGNPFDSRVLEKILYFKQNYPELEIQVDGSVNTETIGILESAGATRFICGSSVFDRDVQENIAKLKSLLQ